MPRALKRGRSCSLLTFTVALHVPANPSPRLPSSNLHHLHLRPMTTIRFKIAADTCFDDETDGTQGNTIVTVRPHTASSA
ncbi:hypothetical protein R3P38DRAFT_1815725 [Favolaschia claudopus]|uniref:Secreted protein n=1 Tax=Favolaschia claudopus TaxID=2862362 RepID=A0AAW0A4C7_9AGAR